MRLGLLILVLFTSVLSSFAQSVADVARKERQRQQSTKSRVLVNANVAMPTTASTPATNTTAPAATATPATSPAKPGELTDRNGRTERFWREAFDKARADLKRAEARVELLDLKVKQINTDMLQYSNFYNRENRLGVELTAAKNDLENARKELEQARKKLSDLEEELRRSGGPAGWAR